MGIEYDGTDYHGWQRQEHISSVQAVVEKAISRVADEPIEVVCAGRTDKGVHALGQVIHFDTFAKRSEQAWIMGTNRYLPPSVTVHWIQLADTNFHARFSATARRYAYLLYCHPTRSSILRQNVTWEHKKLNLTAMREASQYLLGEHDFSSFRGKDCQAKTPVRTVLHLNIIEKSPLVIIDIKANAFLYHMVRNIVGALLAVGHEKQQPAWIKEVIEATDRRCADITAPANGLHFLEVDYPAQFKLPIPIVLQAVPPIVNLSTFNVG
ncbi:MAG: tRNA pseudouridine(38-40) synthase TruA [Legionellales bacterium]|nr:tRNA pseudouridine(38-40) synthase TruA [Legionellales bacterium]